MFEIFQHPIIIGYALLRPFGLFIMFPLFSTKNLGGSLLRNGLMFAFSIPIVPFFIHLAPEKMNYDVWPGYGFLFNELIIGAIIGFVVAIPFWALDSAGFIVDTIRGASMGTVLNPSLGEATSILGILFVQMFIALFFLYGGLGHILSSLYESYVIIPPGHLIRFNKPLMDLIISQWGLLFKLCISFVLPAVVVMVLCDLAIGLINRSAQQLNVFFVAMPIKSALALIMLIISITFGFQVYFEHVSSLGTVIKDMLEVSSHE